MVRGLLVVGIAVLLGVLVGGRIFPADAQEETTYYCTIRPTDVRTCAHFQGCDIQITYTQNTQLTVTGTVTGDRNNGVDTWLVVEDPVQRTTGYIHSPDARAPASRRNGRPSQSSRRSARLPARFTSAA